MLGSYLNQTAILEKRLEPNDYNEYDYSEPMTIPCRIEKGTKFIRKSDKETVEVNSVYYTTVKVDENDLIDSNKVLSVEVMTRLDGGTEGYKVMTWA